MKTGGEAKALRRSGRFTQGTLKVLNMTGREHRSGGRGNITAHSIDSLSEKISRNSVLFATVGLISPIIKIPASKRDSHSRSGCNS